MAIDIDNNIVEVWTKLYSSGGYQSSLEVRWVGSRVDILTEQLLGSGVQEKLFFIWSF